jgi:hypothetical protein
MFVIDDDAARAVRYIGLHRVNGGDYEIPGGDVSTVGNAVMYLLAVQSVERATPAKGRQNAKYSQQA